MLLGTLALSLSGCQGSLLWSKTTIREGDKVTKSETFLPTGTFLQKRKIGKVKIERDEGGVKIDLADTETSPEVEAVKALADIAKGL